ncbi:MAG: alpha/beta hydrolase [Proteobacteria bacterium]|nr:alpha/beta hydrolase [Pseudomonadota bacterium]
MTGTPVSRFITASDGLKLHVHEYGRDSTSLPVICLPGLTRTAEDFDTLATALSAEGRRIIAVDYRGRGRSEYDRDPAKYSLPVELDDVMTILAALQCEPAVFVGTSRGGLLTMLLAAVRPQAIAGAVLNDIGPVLEPAGLERIKGYVGKLPQPKNYDDAAAILMRLFGPQFPKLMLDDWRKSARRGFAEKDGVLVPTYDVALMRTLADLDVSKPIPDLWPQFEALAGVPVMVVRGELSDLLSAATVAEMGRRHSSLETLVVPNQGHAPLLAEGDVMARIAAFVRRCDDRRAALPA